MSTDKALIEKHVSALLADARQEGIPGDVVGRILLNQTVALWLSERRWQDVADELRFTAESLDPETDFEFMRP